MEPSSITSHGAGTGNLRSYATGFVLSIVLTAIPFAVVMRNTFSYRATLAVIGIAALVQVLVHLYYFLHLDTSSKARWNVQAMLFALLIMILIVGGTIWIMYHLNYRMV